jgi:hypothetical protein
MVAVRLLHRLRRILQRLNLLFLELLLRQPLKLATHLLS